jgi:hypothetical protein
MMQEEHPPSLFMTTIWAEFWGKMVTLGVLAQENPCSDLQTKSRDWPLQENIWIIQSWRWDTLSFRLASTIAWLKSVGVTVGWARRSVLKFKPNKKEQLIEVVNQAWEHFTEGKCLKCVERIPCVLKSVIDAEGVYFDEKYSPRKFKLQPVY